MYSYLSNFYPDFIKVRFNEVLAYFDIEVRPEFTMGTMLFFSLGLSLSFSFQFSKDFFPDPIPNALSFVFFFFMGFVLLHTVVYSVLMIVASNRGRFVENILPDALELISANLRSGLTVERALIAANRKEFGYLNYLLSVVGREISTGKDVGEALTDSTRKVRSEKYEKAIELVVMAMRSGGELSRLLGQVAENLVHQKTIEEKIRTGVSTYLIFVGAAVAFAAPFLYGLSTVFVNIIVSSFSNIDIPPSANVPFAVQVSKEMAAFLPNFVSTFTRSSLISLGIMSSFVLGQIKRGQLRDGLVYIPFLVGGALVTFTIVSEIAKILFEAIA